jgi:hypothetical protein
MTPGPTAGAATMRQCPCSSIHRHMPHPAVAGLGAANCRPLAAPANCVRQRRWRAPAAAATDGASSEPAYPYTSSDGRSQKAVLEHIFGPAGGDGSSSSSSSDRAQAPWAVGWQVRRGGGPGRLCWAHVPSQGLLQVPVWCRAVRWLHSRHTH